MSLCAFCHAGCCRRYKVDLTGFDIFNLSKNLELDFSEFAEIVIVEEKYLESCSKHAALFKFTDDDCKNYWRFCLRFVESKAMPNPANACFCRNGTVKVWGFL